MKKKSIPRSAFLNPRVIITLALCATGVVLALLSVVLFSSSTAQAQAPKSNPQVGKLTAQEAKIIADGIKPLLNDSADDLVSVKHADGSVSTDLQGRFQNVTVIKKEAGGTITQGCVNNLDAAAGFFGLDRKTLGLPEKPQPEQPADR
ncbi:MAG: hypothetical protein ABIR71_11920 [Chthoniobacterales bacterium]